MKIIIASDHGGVDLKKNLISELTALGHTITNVGVDTPDSVDYPDIAKKACSLYLQGGFDFGIVICGTGIGISISANKVKGIRCALVHDLYTAQMARAHNNANFIALGARVQLPVAAIEIVKEFIKTQPEGGRHAARVQKISDLEN
jgi:ribose 5-phosphate isomerase B